MDGSIVSPSELKAQHPEEKNSSDFQNHLWAYLFLRPMSFYIAPIFIRLGFSPNQVTLFGGGVLLVGLGLMVTFTSYIPLVIGVLLVNLWYLLDFVDGVVARYYNMTSPLGAFIDWLIGMTYHTLLPFAVAIILYRTAEFETVGFIIAIPGLVWFGIAGIEVFARLFRRTVIQKAELLAPDVSRIDGSQSGVNAQMVVSSFESFKSPILLFSIIFGFLDIWLLAYMAYSALILPPAIYLQIKRLD